MHIIFSCLFFFLMLSGPGMAEDYDLWHIDHEKAIPIWVLPKNTAPENMLWTKPSLPGDLESKRFFSPELCRACHSEIYDQWKGSMMANSWKDPVFIAVYKSYLRDSKSLSEKAEIAMCSRCHTPSGYLDNNTARYFKGDLREVDTRGISCDICHSVEASAGVGNGAYILKPGNASEVEYGTKYGPRNDSAAPIHKSEFSELHTRAELCGMCHDVGHAHNMMPIESTYSEWRTSPYNTGDPKTSTHCQDCHMKQTPEHPATGSTDLPDAPGFSSPQSLGGKRRNHVWQHYFIGGNFAVTSLLGNTQAAQMARDRLAHALTIEIMETGVPIKKGDLNRIKIKVVNSGAGHYLPTGITYVRELWLNLSVKDAEGKTLFESGSLNGKGDIDPDAVVYKTILGEGGKERKPTFFLPAAVQVLHDKRIRPKGFSIEDYSFFVPVDAKGPLSIKIEAKYRSAPQFLVNEMLGKDAPVLPIFVMGMAEKNVNVD